jgi:hypothetical protein
MASYLNIFGTPHLILSISQFWLSSRAWTTMAVKSLEGRSLNTICQGKTLLDFQIPSAGWSSILYITPRDF